ncbi:hypothetical protein F1C16_00090 [Hymenobacter sp. NBH84]|uniref:hypothetical protein n=1 Tax=Hymenobacter sp. NBH84 TaxID=2596915 RepID=UPI001629D208|nr:hypothetical protein [Hymenobacter sp. NBH84]QNE38067.1 hypothetical protein F1C16_00090 [Hymenobacter sp. NBH84]
MLFLKRLTTILVMVYLLLALLFIFSQAARDTFASAIGLGTEPAAFYYTLFVTGVVLLAALLIVENIDSVLLRRSVTQHEGKINELKARLYDHQLEQRERDFQQRPGTVPGTTTYPDEIVMTPTPGAPVGSIPRRPVFPQEDPSLSNAPLEKPNTIIPPANDADNSTTR